jgi:hypothetical protein
MVWVASGYPSIKIEEGGVVGRWGTEVAHLVMVAMWSVRTLLWRSEADWGDT